MSVNNEPSTENIQYTSNVRRTNNRNIECENIQDVHTDIQLYTCGYINFMF